MNKEIPCQRIPPSPSLLSLRSSVLLPKPVSRAAVWVREPVRRVLA
ncbi:MAG: hypothetical protein NTY17_03655 [Planctomycetia bacterium]|nr:hypothetical protein [Planctomycetia bacterium]